MADEVQKPKVTVKSLIVTESIFPTYQQPNFHLYAPEGSGISGEKVVKKVAVVTYPDDGSEINTDPFRYPNPNNTNEMLTWVPADHTWGTSDNWLMYDGSGKLYNGEGIVGEETGVISGGWFVLDLTYFYVDSNGKYAGSGKYSEKGDNTAILEPAPTVIEDGKTILADSTKYDITWNGTAWDITKKVISQYSGVVEYTFVVDSDERLEMWANNVTSDGQDYTSVLIKKGTWNYSATTGINLTSTNTKCIVGETGSKLIITKTNTGTGAGIFYDTLPSTNDFIITNLNIEYKATSGRAIYQARNLTNCHIKSTGTSSSVAVSGAENCYNVSRCSAEGISTGAYGYGFRDCINMRECEGYGEGTTIGTGFAHCLAVQNCSDTSDSKYYDSFFSNTQDSTYLCDNTLEGGWNT